MAATRALVSFTFLAATASARHCPGPEGGSITQIPTSAISRFQLVQDTPVRGTCSWSASANRGIYQSSNAWGNAPDDNSLMGCNAMWPDHSFTNFIMEVDVNGTEDNDGMGITFGWESADNYMRAVLMNDEWPNPAADGVGGPFMKIKARNSRQCLASMDQSNNCFDTLAYLTNDDHGQLTAKSYNPPNWGPSNFNHPSRQMSYSNGPGATGLPEPFAQTYPFQRGIKYHGDNGADIFTLTLIVEDGEVTFQFYHRGQAVGTRASLPSTYNGGKVGFFTYAHQAYFSNVRVTNLDAGQPSGYCGGHGSCDSSTGLCNMPPFPPPPPPPPPPPCNHILCAGGNGGCSGELCVGDGDCDSDDDCAGSLRCGRDNCAAFRDSSTWQCDAPGWDMTDDCCYEEGGIGSPGTDGVRVSECAGNDDGCPVAGPLRLGDGDCDNDADCASGLRCGTDNCAAFHDLSGMPCEAEYTWDTTDDCCYAVGGPGDPDYQGGAPPPPGKGHGGMADTEVDALAASLSDRLNLEDCHNPAAITFAVLGWLAFLFSAAGNYVLYGRAKKAGSGRAKVDVTSSSSTYQAPIATMNAPLSMNDAAQQR